MMPKSLIVAELSANHNNDFDLAVKTIEAMAKSGADAVKVQTYKAESLSLDVDNEYFGPKTSGPWKGYRPWDLYQEASMPYEWQGKLKELAESLGMLFFSSPFDIDGVDFLQSLEVSLFKIASFEINDIPLITKVARCQKPIIMSTGVADESDIQKAVDACRLVDNNDITLLKCTSQYPATLEAANLTTMVDMGEKFSTKVGLSDHTMGYIAPVVAVSLGATLIEKHFILDRQLGGVDSTFSMEPDEFAEMVRHVRQAESVLGHVDYSVSEDDKHRRRSLFAVRDIAIGEAITLENIKSLRPGVGLSPEYQERLLGKESLTFIPKGTPLNWSFFE